MFQAQRGEAELLNTRLDLVKFINNNGADEAAFLRLRARILALAPDAKIPSSNELYAWRRSFKIYADLKQREGERQARVATASAPNFNFEKEIHAGGMAHGELTRLVQGGVIGSTELEYLGIEEGDLKSLTGPHDPHRRTPLRFDWRAVCDRLRDGLAKWQHMTEAEKAAIPAALRTLRYERKVLELIKQVTTLAERVAALESQNSSGKEAA